MGINVTQTMCGYQFENGENRKNTVLKILAKQGASEETILNFSEKPVLNAYDGIAYANAQLSVLKAASQISINGTLKETLKYLKSRPAKKNPKEPVLGELWNLFSQENIEYEDIIDLEIDFSAKNIFAA